jgi:hypothetical protein
MDGSSVTRAPASPTRAIVADEAFCRQAGLVLLCDPGPYARPSWGARGGGPGDGRWALKHETDPGLRCGQGLPNWARSAGAALAGGPDGMGAPRRQREGLRWAGPRPEVHHAAPRCLVSLHERATACRWTGGHPGVAGVEWEATRWRVPVEISRDGAGGAGGGLRGGAGGGRAPPGPRGGLEAVGAQGRQGDPQALRGRLVHRCWPCVGRRRLTPEDLEAARVGRMKRRYSEDPG